MSQNHTFESLSPFFSFSFSLVLALVVLVVVVICIGVGMDIVESVMGGLGVEFCCAYNS